jgi:eukaryotic-like serine/threonine-protein kinase
VYRARDTKLDREVAIKVLPELFVSDPERVARFQREAKTLAAMNHPHIGSIYGLEDADGVRALVLELVEGPTLADRIAQGAIPLDEALPIARQIAEALEAAHEAGIIHRDLKPANIKLRPDGTVKVLDFGLAKALEPTSASSANVTASPTITTPAIMTGIGMILGTAAYMSPEQAKGRPADKRSDIWAFGCVLFEMLTAKRAFEGEDISDTLAAILRGEPDWSALPSDLPGQVRAIVMRCLRKDRKARIPDVSVVRFLLDEPSTPAASPDRPVAVPTRAGWAWKAATAVLAAATAAAFSAWYVARSSSPQVTRFFVPPPEGGSFFISLRTAAQGVISPDGRTLAFAARDAAGKVTLWVRPIDSLTAQSLPGTDDATNPFWSPDSRFIGYSTPGKLMKIAPSAGRRLRRVRVSA